MGFILQILLMPLVILVVTGFTRLSYYLAALLASRRTKEPYREFPGSSGPPQTRDQALEYLQHPEIKAVAVFYRRMLLYRFFIVTGLIDGTLIFLHVVLQIPGPEMLLISGGLILLFTFIEFMACREGLKVAAALEDPSVYMGKTDGELIDFAQRAHGECRKVFKRIERMNGWPWKIFCAVCIAAAVFLAAAQLDYKYRAKSVGDGILEMGGWQYRVLDDGTAEIVRYTGIWKNITVPSSFHGVPVSSTGPKAFLWKRGDYLPFSRKDLTSVRLPEGLVRIGDNSFENCGELTDVYLPGSVTRIGDNAFNGCRNLKEIVLPESLIHIGDFAFRGCREIAVIRIPDSVTEIGVNPFAECTNLRKIEITENYPLLRVCGEGLCRGDGGELFWYPAAGEFREVTLPPEIRRIGDCAFFGHDTLEKVILPEGLEEIGNEAFNYCSRLREVVFPDSLLSVGNSAFNNCRQLTEAVLPDSVRTVGDSAFAHCAALASIRFPDGLQAVGNNTFAYCSALASVRLPDSVRTVGDYAFVACTGLTSVRLPDRLTQIGGYAFYHCDSLAEIAIPAGVSEIRANTFSRCENLTRVGLPEGLTSVGSDAFSGCVQLASVVIPAAVQHLPFFNPFCDSTVWIVTPGSRAEKYCQAYGIEFCYAGEEEPGQPHSESGSA